MLFFSKIHRGFLRLVIRVFALLEFVLLLRLLLKFLNANEKAFAISFLYNTTNVLVWPFKFIFPNMYWQNRLIDMTVISAMVGYCILFFAFSFILKALQED